MSEATPPRRPSMTTSDWFTLTLLLAAASVLFALLPVDWKALPPFAAPLAYLTLILVAALLFILPASAWRARAVGVAVAAPSGYISDAFKMFVVGRVFRDAEPGDPFAERSLDVLELVLIHFSTLNNWRGADIRSTLAYLDVRSLTSLDTTLRSSDEERVRTGWKAFREGVADQTQVVILSSVKSLLSQLPAVVVPHDSIPQLVGDLKKFVGKFHMAG